MADNEPVTTWWAVGAKDQATVRKYLSYLHKHSLFGGHVGLREDIRNEKPNRSLDSSRGVYDMVEVYSISGTLCQIGTVVNFKTDDDNNVEGTTYVYPCIDKSRPMGYMVTRAEPDVWGVCVVQGVVEVLLNYESGSTIPENEYKDYVEYDLDSGNFKFSDSGYPVFNVYQDVSGDWIAIILFGNTVAEGGKYDGPFATSIATITGGTAYINIAEGNVDYNGIAGLCTGFAYDAEDLEMSLSLTTGESVWLKTDASGSQFTFDFATSTTGFVDTGTLFYTRIAEFTEDGKIKQIQYGDIKDKGIGYPDYYALCGNGDSLTTSEIEAEDSGSYASGSGSGSVTGNPVIGIGITYIIPVPGNVPIQFRSDAPECIDTIIFSPFYNTAGSHQYQTLQLNTEWTTPASGGWVRVSVLDNGLYPNNSMPYGACLRFYCGNEDWTEALPLFRHGNYEGIGYPDYYALCGNGTEIDSETAGVINSGIDTSGGITGSGDTSHSIGIGVTFLLPVPAGASIKFFTDAPECIATAIYAPSLNMTGTHTYHYLSMGNLWTTPSGGWVCISVLDNGAYPTTSLPYGACVRFYMNGVDYTSALPLFRHGSYGGKQNLSATVSSNVGTISLTGSTGSVYLKAGSNISLSGDNANGITITCTATPGTSTFYTPNYTNLALGAGAPEYGIGHTFVLPVKKGNVGFFDDGGGASGVWTDVNGTSIHGLTSSVLYDAPSDGWIRVSVIDGGYSSGACLSIQDISGNIPVYKYSPSFFAYNGSFKATKLGTNTSGTEGYFDVEIKDGLNRNYNYNYCAGFVFEGTGVGEATQIPIASATVSCTAGREIYLVHSDSNGYEFQVVSNRSALSNDYDVAILIAYTRTGEYNPKVYQVQFGDITIPSRNLVVENPATGTVSVGVSGGSNKVKFIEGTNVTLTGDATNRTITITATGSSTTVTGLSYPDYYELGTIPSTVPESQGITFLLPVQANHTVGYYTDSGSPVIAKYAPAVGTSGGSSFYLSNGVSSDPVSVDGWVRISVFDDGSTPNKCLRFRDNGNEFPLYKYGAISGGTSGGGGYSGDGGSINAPDWGLSNHDIVVVPSTASASGYLPSGASIAGVVESYTTTSSGWIYACAEAIDGAAHLYVNTVQFKVASHGGGSICIPVRANTSIRWNVSNADEAWCVFYADGASGSGT